MKNINARTEVCYSKELKKHSDAQSEHSYVNWKIVIEKMETRICMPLSLFLFRKHYHFSCSEWPFQQPRKLKKNIKFMPCPNALLTATTTNDTNHGATLSAIQC